MFNLIWGQSGLAAESGASMNTLKMQLLNNYSKQRFHLQEEAEEDNYKVVYIICDKESERGEKLALEVTENTILTMKLNRSIHQQWRLTHISAEQVYIQPIIGAQRMLIGGDCIGSEVTLITSRGTEEYLKWRVVPTTGILFPPLSDDELLQYSIDYEDVQTQLKTIIEDHGFCIINNVLDEDQVQSTLALWGQDLLDVLDYETLVDAIDNASDDQSSLLKECISRLNHADLASIPKLWSSLSPSKWDYSAHSLCQASMPWSVRLNQRVRHVFSLLYDDDIQSLVVGMDAVFFSPMSSPPATEDIIWGHADMNLFKDGVADWKVYQSIVALWSQDGWNSSTTVVWPDSHKEIFKTLMTAEGLHECGQFVMLDKVCGMKGAKLRERYIHEARRVPLRPGSMIVFNSKLVHQGWNKGPRLAVPVCWEPRERRDSKTALPRKIRLCASGLPSTHWASLGIQHGLDLLTALRPRPMLLGSDVEYIDLPLKGTHRPYTLKSNMDFVNTVLPICEKLRSSDDSDRVLAEILSTYLRPEIFDSL